MSKTTAQSTTATGAAAALAVGFFCLANSASSAADLGGTCCADLEERIAELEATTLRTGTRKVKLAISGHVNEAVLFWNDGQNSDAYVVTNENKRTRFRLLGEAKVNEDWKAGFRQEIGIRGANGRRVNQDDARALPDTGLDLMHNWFYVLSKTFGKLSVGQTPTSAEGITELTLSGTADVVKYSDVEDMAGGFFLRRKGVAGHDGLSALPMFRLINNTGSQPGEGFRRRAVRYETPALAGVTGSASIGEDDYWDAAIRYAGEFSGFRISAGIAYGYSNEIRVDQSQPGFECLAQGGIIASGDSDARCHQLGGSLAIYHDPTGLFASVAAGQLTDDLITGSTRFAGTNADGESTFWAMQGGIEPKLVSLGKTTFYGEYYKDDGGANARRTLAAEDAINPFGANSRIFATELEMYGAGVIQQIDAASMSLYTLYRHYSPEVDVLSGKTGAGVTGSVAIDGIDVLMTGGLIKF